MQMHGKIALYMVHFANYGLKKKKRTQLITSMVLLLFTIYMCVHHGNVLYILSVSVCTTSCTYPVDYTELIRRIRFIPSVSNNCTRGFSLR